MPARAPYIPPDIFGAYFSNSVKKTDVSQSTAPDITLFLMVWPHYADDYVKYSNRHQSELRNKNFSQNLSPCPTLDFTNCFVVHPSENSTMHSN